MRHEVGKEQKRDTFSPALLVLRRQGRGESVGAVGDCRCSSSRSFGTKSADLIRQYHVLPRRNPERPKFLHYYWKVSTRFLSESRSLSLWRQGVHCPWWYPPPAPPRSPLGARSYPNQESGSFPAAAQKARAAVLHAQRAGEAAPGNQRAPVSCVQTLLFLFRQHHQGGAGQLLYYIWCLIRSGCSGSLRRSVCREQTVLAFQDYQDCSRVQSLCRSQAALLPPCLPITKP